MRSVGWYFTLDFGPVGDTQSAAIRVGQLEGYSISSKWIASTGRTGTLRLQSSNNAFFQRNTVTGGDLQEITANDLENPNAIWEDIPGSDKAVDATADQHTWNVAEAYYSAVRVVFVENTNGSATDDFEAYVYGKGTQ